MHRFSARLTKSVRFFEPACEFMFKSRFRTSVPKLAQPRGSKKCRGLRGPTPQRSKMGRAVVAQPNSQTTLVFKSRLRESSISWVEAALSFHKTHGEEWGGFAPNLVCIIVFVGAVSMTQIDDFRGPTLKYKSCSISGGCARTAVATFRGPEGGSAELSRSLTVSDRRRNTTKSGKNSSESLCASLWVPCRIVGVWFGSALCQTLYRNRRSPAGSLTV